MYNVYCAMIAQQCKQCSSITFSTVSPNPFTSVKSAQDEPALIYETHGAPVAVLIIKHLFSKLSVTAKHAAFCLFVNITWQLF